MKKIKDIHPFASGVPRCSTCPSLVWDWNTDEYQCKEYDFEQFILNRGQRTPKFCPRLKRNQKKGETNGSK